MTDRVTIAVPLAQAGAANRLAAILDPSGAGEDTFSVPASVTGAGPATHVMCCTWMSQQYQTLLCSRDAVAMLAALDQLATARGRDAPTQTDVDAFCGVVLIGDEVTVQPVVEEPAP